jgi:hypothetical protein
MARMESQRSCETLNTYREERMNKYACGTCARNELECTCDKLPQRPRRRDVKTRDVQALEEITEAAQEFQAASNELWWAQNPEEPVSTAGRTEALPIEEAQELHSEAFTRLGRAVHQAKRVLDERARPAPVPELIAAVKEVLRISDREHDAWRKVRELIAAVERT